VIWWGIFAALTALVPADISGALLVFVAVRFLLGAGEAVMHPAGNQFITAGFLCVSAASLMAGSLPV
jgi:ACS family glucarate transporter-like MFS transporter